MPDKPGLKGYIADLRRINAETDDESEIMKQIRPLVARAALSVDRLRDEIYKPNEEQGFAVRVLHEEADHSLAVLAVSWLPGSGAHTHDYGTWAVYNDSDKITVSLHTYGKHPNFTDRAQYDMASKTANEYQFAVE